MTDEHGPHCEGCRQLALITERNEALAAAKAAYAALPEDRRAALNAQFDLTTIAARHHATYSRDRAAGGSGHNNGDHGGQH